MTTTKRPANDDHAAAALEEELLEEVAQQEADEAMAGPPSATGIRLSMFARELERQIRPAVPRPAPTAGSRPALDLARQAGAAEAVPLAYGSADGEPDPVAAVRDLDTARIGRLSRAELVRLIAAHPCRAMEADLLEELPDADLRDELRALRGKLAAGAPS